MNLYEILEIKPTASELEIKKAYTRLVKIYHPDKNKSPDANEKFQKIHSAYEILINNESRQRYLKMNQKEQTSFVEILEKIISDNFDLNELKKYGINLERIDFDYIQKNLMNFIKSINVGELLNLVKNGIVERKNFNNITNCSESECDAYDETSAEYIYSLPIILQRVDKLDINLDLPVKLGDIMNMNKRKIKIKRKIGNTLETHTFIFNMSAPYIVYYGAGDMMDGDVGNLIIHLILPNNLLWTNDVILIQNNISLYQMIYGMNIDLDIGEGMKINITNWVPSRDGFFIQLMEEKNIENHKIVFSNYKETKIKLGIKLYLDYIDTPEKAELLKQYFS
jgi:curved DNA-binding protein CbpA